MGAAWKAGCASGWKSSKRLKEAVGEETPLGIRVPGNDFMPGGLTNQDTARFRPGSPKEGDSCRQRHRRLA